MKKINKAFTLVELLVVITIIAILWVVAYTSFGWATDKAKVAAKMQNIDSITKALSMYKTDKSFYPKPAVKSTTNIWWYDASVPEAKKTCTTWLTSNSDWKLTWTITNLFCGWDVKNSDWNLIWKKWTLAYSWAIKKYLKSDAYDNQIWDLELNWKKLIEYWIWRFPYAIFNNWSGHATEYNIAYTIKDKNWNIIAKVKWTYNEESCADSSKCPWTLIWPWMSNFVKDWDKAPNIPYKLDF